MNILEQEAEIKGLSTEAIKGQLQGGPGGSNISQPLALVELSRRNKMARQSANAAAAANGPQRTVVNDLLAQSRRLTPTPRQPQQPQQASGQGFAYGGLVPAPQIDPNMARGGYAGPSIGSQADAAALPTSTGSPSSDGKNMYEQVDPMGGNMIDTVMRGHTMSDDPVLGWFERGATLYDPGMAGIMRLASGLKGGGLVRRGDSDGPMLKKGYAGGGLMPGPSLPPASGTERYQNLVAAREMLQKRMNGLDPSDPLAASIQAGLNQMEGDLAGMENAGPPRSWPSVHAMAASAGPREYGSLTDTNPAPATLAAPVGPKIEARLGGEGTGLPPRQAPTGPVPETDKEKSNRLNKAMAFAQMAAAFGRPAKPGEKDPSLITRLGEGLSDATGTLAAGQTEERVRGLRESIADNNYQAKLKLIEQKVLSSGYLSATKAGEIKTDLQEIAAQIVYDDKGQYAMNSYELRKKPDGTTMTGVEWQDFLAKEHVAVYNSLVQRVLGGRPGATADPAQNALASRRTNVTRP